MTHLWLSFVALWSFSPPLVTARLAPLAKAVLQAESELAANEQHSHPSPGGRGDCTRRATVSHRRDHTFLIEGMVSWCEDAEGKEDNRQWAACEASWATTCTMSAKRRQNHNQTGQSPRPHRQTSSGFFLSLQRPSSQTTPLGSEIILSDWRKTQFARGRLLPSPLHARRAGHSLRVTCHHPVELRPRS